MRGNVPDLDLPTPAETRHTDGVDLTDLNHKLAHKHTSLSNYNHSTPSLSRCLPSPLTLTLNLKLDQETKRGIEHFNPCKYGETNWYTHTNTHTHFRSYLLCLQQRQPSLTRIHICHISSNQRICFHDKKNRNVSYCVRFQSLIVSSILFTPTFH